jgi:hypothetical protein
MIVVSSGDEGGQIVQTCGSPTVRVTGESAIPGLGCREGKIRTGISID